MSMGGVIRGAGRWAHLRGKRCVMGVKIVHLRALMHFRHH